jgi:protein-tyrosine phosphatase
VIDLHSHILPGLDDGAATLEESVEIGRAAADDGIRVVAATPHVRDDFPTKPAAMKAALKTAREALAEAGVELEVIPGGEIALDWLGRLGVRDLRRFSLGGGGGYLLVETPYFGWPMGLANALFALRRRGLVPVLAHPERNPEVWGRPELLRDVVAAGALVQVTAASLDGRLGRRVADAAFALLEARLVHLLASDAHAPGLREAGLSAARARVGDAALGRWLTEEVPAAILAGSELPARPS